jgi:1,4-alpha-glucan branching enzyme
MIRKQRSTDRSVTKVTFVLPDDGQDVSVIADFNSWNPHAHPLKPRPNGTRSIQVALAAGTQARFRYLSGGVFFDDPNADGYEPNGRGETHSLVSA